MATLLVLFACFELVAYTTGTVRYISPGNHVLLAGNNQNFTCTSYSSFSSFYWHFYSLTPGSKPCGFDSQRLHLGISLCPSATRVSVAHLSTSFHSTILIVTGAQLSDAGTYTCGGRNPNNHTATSSIIIGVIASDPVITSNVSDNATLTCRVTYNGTNLMPLVMQLLRKTWNHEKRAWIDRLVSAQSIWNDSSVFQSSWTFTATERIFIVYFCIVSFDYPTGSVLAGEVDQYEDQHLGSFYSMPVASKTEFVTASHVSPFTSTARTETTRFSISMSTSDEGHEDDNYQLDSVALIIALTLSLGILLIVCVVLLIMQHHRFRRFKHQTDKQLAEYIEHSKVKNEEVGGDIYDQPRNSFRGSLSSADDPYSEVQDAIRELPPIPADTKDVAELTNELQLGNNSGISSDIGQLPASDARYSELSSSTREPPQALVAYDSIAKPVYVNSDVALTTGVTSDSISDDLQTDFGNFSSPEIETTM